MKYLHFSFLAFLVLLSGCQDAANPDLAKTKSPETLLSEAAETANQIYTPTVFDHSGFEIFYGSVHIDNIRPLLDFEPGSDFDFFITSWGGVAAHALILSQILEMRRPRTTHVGFFCESACSEWVLPSVSNIVFDDAPMIGFHGNTISDAVLNAQNSPLPYCEQENADAHVELLTRKGLNPDFWKDQYAVIGIRSIRYEERNLYGIECTTPIVETDQNMWYPNSEQLRELYGLEFTGSVCADDVETCKRMVNHYLNAGTPVVIASTPYVTKKALSPL